MATAQLTPYEKFLVLFNHLKCLTRDDPGRIPWLWKQSKRLREIGREIDNLCRAFKYALARSKKIVGPVPAGFDQAFEEYQQRYAENIFHVTCFVDIDLMDEIEDAASPSVDPTNEAVDVPTEAQTEKDEEESEERFLIEVFDPEFDDAYEELTGVLGDARDRVESAVMGRDDGPDLINLLSKGVGAFDYYRDVIGVDLEGIARRWKQIPHIFVPRHVSAAYGRSQRGALFDLLNDAVRAYVFGAPCAAMAMCRAVCEDVLKKKYGLDISKDRRGYLPGLSKIIILAEKKYEWINKLNLRRKIEHVNELLHSYDRSKKMTAVDERVVLDFLTTVKTLIEKTPSPGETAAPR